MPQTQLPPSAAMIAQGDNQSPLGNYLAAHLTASRGQVAYDLVRPIMEGALAIAALQPFDTEETVTLRRGGNPTEEVSLLHAVMLLANRNHQSGTLRRWPQSSSDFGEHLIVESKRGQPLGVDTEWVAAALTAAGCNPWNSRLPSAKTIPEEVRLSIWHGCGGLVEQFLNCPNAPTAQSLAQSPSPDQTDSKKESNWVFVSRDRISNCVLEVLLEKGARIKDDRVLVQALSSATVEAVELFAKYGLTQMSLESRQKVEAAWKERSAQLGSDIVKKMQMSIWGEVSNAMSPASLDVGNLLSVEWDIQPSGSASQAYDFLGGKGVEGLAGVGALKSGPMAGKWSVLAAAAASRIRQGVGGTLGWSVPLMLHKEFNEARKTWITADCATPPFKGSLESALGFDWRPGISVDGIVALSLFAQRGNDLRHSQDDLIEQQVLKDIKQFGLATNIVNPAAWARDHAQSAAEFTCLVLKSPKVKASRCLMFAWETAIRRNPGMASAISSETKVEMLQALSAKFKLSQTWSSSPARAPQRNAFASIAASLFPELANATDLLSDKLSSTPLSAALIVYLASAAPPGVNPMDQLSRVSARLGDMTKQDIEIAGNWIDSLIGDEKETQPMRASLEQWSLNLSTPQAASRRALRL